jgi:hypothetical protein
VTDPQDRLRCSELWDDGQAKHEVSKMAKKGLRIALIMYRDLHDKYPASFSPQPFAILGFFGPQQIIQLLWLRELWRSEPEVEKGTLRYAPWYALGNSCIALWMFLWVR